jgi:glycosyltransferase involved in cell wall biosynthesis
MKILHIISSGGMYGAEAVILNMSRTINTGQPNCKPRMSDGSQNYSAIAVFSNSPNPNVQLYDRATAEAIESHLISCSGQVDFKVTAKIRELVERTNADIVHVHGYKADIYVYLALHRTKVPFISTCHTWYDNELLVTLYGVMDRFVLRHYAAVVAVSKEVKQRLLKAGVGAKKTFLISNGIDLAPFDNAIPTLRGEAPWEGRLIVGLVGRLSLEKGVDIFLRSAASILQTFPSAMFIVVGDGEGRPSLELLIDELGIRSSVSLLGRRDDMPSIYASIDLLVSASRKEGLPIALLEGMASRCPVVATSVGEIPAVVEDGHTGILVPPEDIDALSKAVTSLLSDSELRARMGSAAKERVKKHFSAERMTTDYLHVYQEAMIANGQVK